MSVGVPKATPRFADSLGGLTGPSRCGPALGYGLVEWKETEQNQQREGARGVEARRRLPEPSPRGVTQHTLHSFSGDL